MKHLETPFQIDTPRLILRDFIYDDLNDLCEICLDNEVTKHIDYIRFSNTKEVEKWMTNLIKHNSKKPRESYNLSIIDKKSNILVGWIGIGTPDDPKSADMDFGFAIKKKYWGNGFATEALKYLLEYCFSTLKIQKIVGECDEDNYSSENVMKKVGMKFEKLVFEGKKRKKIYSIEKIGRGARTRTEDLIVPNDAR